VSTIYWLDTEPKVAMAVVSCPRGDEKLKGDLADLKSGGIDTVLSLLEEDEAVWLGLGDEGKMAKEAGMNFISFPIPDANVPMDPVKFQLLVADLAIRVMAGETIGIHCRGCIGRSTVMAACMLIHLGFAAETALSVIETARGCPIPDTMEQENWILRFRPQV